MTDQERLKELDRLESMERFEDSSGGLFSNCFMDRKTGHCSASFNGERFESDTLEGLKTLLDEAFRLDKM